MSSNGISTSFFLTFLRLEVVQKTKAKLVDIKMDLYDSIMQNNTEILFPTFLYYGLLEIANKN